MRDSIVFYVDAWENSVSSGNMIEAAINLRNVRSYAENIRGLTDTTAHIELAMAKALNSSRRYFEAQSSFSVDPAASKANALGDMSALKDLLLASQPNDVARALGLD